MFELIEKIIMLSCLRQQQNFHYIIIKDNSDINPFRYCDEYYDKETDSIYLRARYYSPSVGRFITEDPIKAGLNWYSYANNNPIRYIDPMGLIAEGDENLSDYVQIIINGSKKDGTGGLSLVWQSATFDSDRAAIGNMANELRTFDKNGGSFNKVYLLNDPNAGGDLKHGHSAVLIVKDDGKGLFFSYYPAPNASNTFTKLVSAPGVMHFAVLDSNGVSNALGGGKIDCVGLHFDWGGGQAYVEQEQNEYTENIKIGITNSNGIAIAKKGASIFAKPGRYSGATNQCSDAAYSMLKAGSVKVTWSGTGWPNNWFERMQRLH